MSVSETRPQRLAPTPAALLYAVQAEKFLSGSDLLARACSVLASQSGTERVGQTSTAICVMSSEPPRLLVAIERATRLHAVVTRSGALSINVLSAAQLALTTAFSANAQPEQPFDVADWKTGIAGSPVLKEALASLECRIVELVSADTKTPLICEVLNVATSDSTTSPLVYFKRQLMALAPESLQTLEESYDA